MKMIHTNRIAVLFVICAFAFLLSCTSEATRDNVEHSATEQLATIDSLLRDAGFSESMAKALDSSYYAGIGQAAPEFISPAEDTITFKSARNEKIAMNLAGFYALECGIVMLSEQPNTTPVQWLQKISDKSIDSGSTLLLNRFANATWKAGQPFRSMSRITNANFIGANGLSKEEVEKDHVQIYHAAEKLLVSMKDVTNSPLNQQMEKLRTLLQDTAFALEMATHLHASYQIGKNQVDPLLTPADDTAKFKKSVKELKIATSIAGFYAAECALNYLVTTKNELPSTILQSLVDSSMSNNDQLIFARFANATWKAGQPFRDLNRISRATFTPFYFLNEADVEKDLVQIRSAASRLLPFLVNK